MPTTWKNKMIEKGFNYADSTTREQTDFFETRVENLEPKGEKKKSSTVTKKLKDKKSTKKRELEDSDSIVVKSSEDSSVDHKCVKNSASYMNNVVILQISAKINVL